MTQCEWCKDVENIKKLDKMCVKGEEAWRIMIQTANFVKANPTFVGFSGGALRPLIREQDPEIKAKVIQRVSNPDMSDSTRRERYGTESKMKKAIARYHDPNPEGIKEVKEIEPKNLWNMIEQAEYTRRYVKMMIMNGANPASIRELVIKAIGVVEQE